MFDEDGEPQAPPAKNRRQSRKRRRDKDTGKRSPVAAADDGSRDSTRRKNTGKVELGAEEMANMRRFGLDPTDPKVVKEYALNKRQADLEEASNA